MTDPPSTRDRRLRSAALAALVALTLVRFAVAARTPISGDEAYYWVWSHALAPGYLDHPPMVALWIWIGTSIMGPTALGVRLLAPIAAAAGTLLLADTARLLLPALRAPLRAAVLLNATLMFAVGAVTMTPDTPLLFFWTAALWAWARIVAGGRGAWWLLVGVAAGLGLDSKYTAALLGVGILAWLATKAGRPWLRTAWPWAGGVLAAGLFAPVLAWNAAHGWASVLKQGGRSADWAPSHALRYLGELVAGQFGLATPLIAILFVTGMVAALRARRDPRAALILAAVIPGLIVFVEHAFGDRVQANWVAVLYPGCALAAAGLSARGWRPAAALGAVLTLLLYIQATVAPFPLPQALDPTLRLAGWDALAREAAAAARQDGDGYLASEEYGPASLLAWASPGLPVVAAGARWMLVDLPATDISGPGLLLVSVRHREPPDPALWIDVTPLGTLVRRSGPLELERFTLYRVTRRREAPSKKIS